MVASLSMEAIVVLYIVWALGHVTMVIMVQPEAIYSGCSLVTITTSLPHNIVVQNSVMALTNME